MKLKFALATAALALVAGSAANAQIVITLDNPNFNPGAPVPQVITGTVDIQGSEEATGVTLNATVPGFSFINNYENWLTDFLNTNGTFPGAADDYTGPVFTITAIGAPQPPTPYAINFSVIGNQGREYSPPGGVTAVPEPGTVAMLVGGLIGGGLVVARRRRK